VTTNHTIDMDAGETLAAVARLLRHADAAYRKSPVLLIESPHPGGVAG
jgi:hypothetical protein